MSIYNQTVTKPTETNALDTTVSDVILSSLSAWGVKRIYGVAGDAILPFLNTIGRKEVIPYIPVNHEASAAFMASAKGKCTGKLAVALGTSGPGLANMLNGIADAAMDRIPLLVITGQVATLTKSVRMPSKT